MPSGADVSIQAAQVVAPTGRGVEAALLSSDVGDSTTAPIDADPYLSIAFQLAKFSYGLATDWRETLDPGEFFHGPGFDIVLKQRLKSVLDPFDIFGPFDSGGWTNLKSSRPVTSLVGGKEFGGVRLVDMTAPYTDSCGPGGGGPSEADLDNCCLLHDRCYGEADLSGADVLKHYHGRGASNEQKECDAPLCECAKEVDPNSLSTTEKVIST